MANLFSVKDKVVVMTELPYSSDGRYLHSLAEKVKNGYPRPQ